MSPWLADDDFTLYHGAALTVLRELPSESVHCAVTSPPFFGLRDYQVAGQIGLEERPELWAARLVEVFRELRRVLRKDGTLWLECGDSYDHGTTTNRRPLREHEKTYNHGYWSSERLKKRTAAGLKPKDLILTPFLLAMALRTDGWYLRSTIIWAKPNPMPESVTDRPTTAHSYVFLLSREARYFYDAEAIREPSTGDQKPRNGNGQRERSDMVRAFDTRVSSPSRNARSVWTIATEPLPYDHYAAFPQALVEPCIKAGTSERGVCAECGAPWVRVVERAHENPGHRGTNGQRERSDTTRGFEKRLELSPSTVGWQTSCSCDAGEPIPATVLDPFIGSGTTALVARRLGRHCIGIELSERYCEIAAERTKQLSLLAPVS